MRNNYTIIINEIHDIRAEIKELREEITRYKGFLGGVMWSFAALSAAVHFVLQWIRG